MVQCYLSKKTCAWT